jgi:hypothetical protein
MDAVYTIPEYCSIEKISRAKLYSEWKDGGGVKFFKRGKKILITDSARLAYREKLTQQTSEQREDKSSET